MELVIEEAFKNINHEDIDDNFVGVFPQIP